MNRDPLSIPDLGCNFKARLQDVCTLHHGEYDPLMAAEAMEIGLQILERVTAKNRFADFRPKHSEAEEARIARQTAFTESMTRVRRRNRRNLSSGKLSLYLRCIGKETK